MNKEWGSVAIGTRMNDRCDPLFFNSWSHLIAGGLRKGDAVLDAAVELSQHFAATVLAQYFLKKCDCDTLLMVDTDMVFKPDTLNKLRDDPAGWEYDVLSALSVTRRKPFYPIVLRTNKDNTGYDCAREAITGKPVPADTVGTGFTLIRRSVFKAIEAKLGIDKWFFEFGPSGLGEDTQFCQRAIEVGAKIGVHTGVNIGHRGPLTFIWDYETKRTMMEASDQCRELF